MKERNNELFVDSNFFIALLNREDSLHERTRRMSEKLAEREVSYIISNFIFLEIVTITSMRAGREIAVQGGDKILKSSRVRTVHVDEKLHQESWRIFQETTHKDIGFVDCSTIATMKSEGIQKLLTFDTTDFKKLQSKYRFSFYE